MQIVEFTEELQDFQRKFLIQSSLIIPIFSDIYRHPSVNKICLLYIFLFDSREEFILPFSHNEAFNLDYKIVKHLISKEKVFILNKKGFLFFNQNVNFYDADLIEYFQYNQRLNINDISTPAHKSLISKFHKEENINEFIPLVKHYENCVSIREIFIESFKTFIFDESFENYNEFFVRGLHNIEKNGLYVNRKLFIERFKRNSLENDLVFSEYNIYNRTSRPSNSFDGINFGSLKKDDDTRKVFESRFPNTGFLIQYDYNAHHLRLIANLINYQFPKNCNAHEYLGKQYFHKNKLTADEIKESKLISFRQLYGNIKRKYLSIPFFNMTEIFIRKLWDNFQRKGYIETPVFKRKLYSHFYNDINKDKLFNYLLQTYEAEKNMLVLNKIFTYSDMLNSKLILFTYDSYLFDFDINDGKESILKLKNIIEQDGKYPTKIQVGANYKELVTKSL